MENFANQRLRQFAFHLRNTGKVLNDSDFAQKAHRNRSVMSDYLNGHRSITPRFVTELAAVFPELNAQWLLDENCTEMLKDSPAAPAAPAAAPQSAPAPSSDSAALLRIIDAQARQIDQLLNIVAKLQEAANSL